MVLSVETVAFLYAIWEMTLLGVNSWTIGDVKAYYFGDK